MKGAGRMEPQHPHSANLAQTYACSTSLKTPAAFRGVHARGGREHNPPPPRQSGRFAAVRKSFQLFPPYGLPRRIRSAYRRRISIVNSDLLD
jgi:hypothetical protein